MSLNPNICIIIPCYNEGANFRMKEYTDFIAAHPEVYLCFVNDGSKDNTLETLVSLQKKFLQQIHISHDSINVGKAEAIRRGAMYCEEHVRTDYYAYLDADLAVSLEECLAMKSHLNESIEFCCASRILKLGSEIKRSRVRFFISRVFATLISELLEIKVYDTQCGCKVFDRKLIKTLFEQPFVSTWLFDVELFFRILIKYDRKNGSEKMLEIPLKRYVDPGDSKVKMSYFFHMFSEMLKIKRRYRSSVQD
ncbi:MAG: dolichyl-phosphate beta-glucosyltransferase [Patiriisocius sp.]|jgi:dolichyl-phosphate beta-glucosyltransferase